MKKKGFTLAEVLITICMIGIIASITLPNLSGNISKKKVGPALAKAVNTLENVNKTVLQENGARKIDEVNDDYLEILDSKTKGSIAEGWFNGDDSISYSSVYLDEEYAFSVIIDTNGIKKGPNIAGKDKFRVFVLPDGIVVPAGGQEDVDLGLSGLEEVKTCTSSSYDLNCTDHIVREGWEMKY